MNILHTVENYYPSVGGMQEAVRQISEHLVLLGNDVTVATSCIQGRGFDKYGGVVIKEFKVEGNYINGMRGEVDKYRDFVTNGNFDIVANFAAQQWASDALYNILDEIESKKVFIPTGFSKLYDKSCKTYFNKMANWMKKYDMNVFLSNNYRDIDFARKNDVKNICVIPDHENFISL